MTDNATPKRRANYSRPTKYPARLSTMLSQEARDEIDALVQTRGDTLGEISRGVIDDGIALDRAYNNDPGLREDVQRLARDAGVPVADALTTMLTFAVRETRRRTERNAALARAAGQAFAEATGIVPDGVSVGNVEISEGRES